MSDNRFKPYQQHQLRLLPLDLSELIPQDHLVRVIDSVIESIDIAALKSFYPGGGAPAYDPRMMLKVIVYAYSSGIYSSRKISQATAENIHFMWLTGCVRLDHMTINRFRSERLRGCFESVFAETVELIAEMGLVTLNEYFIDGTKLEANANKYTFTWKRACQTNQNKLRLNVGKLLDDIDALNEAEDRMFEDMPTPGEITSEDIASAAERINARLREKAEANTRDKDLEKAKKKLEADYLPRMRRYEKDLADMKGRKSLSKTDRDATFMRMKEDHMRNGQLKAGYNIQNGTENQFVIHSTLHQRPGDTACFVPHMESFRETYGRLPEEICADAGYGSEQNYEWLEDNEITGYVKYNWFHKEQKRSFKKDHTQPANWKYDEKKDEWTCAEGRKLVFLQERTRTSDLGYKSSVRIYECESCAECPHMERCTKSNGDRNRRIEANLHLRAYRQKAAELLTSDHGKEMRKRRATDVETVFGDLKRNWGFTRFTLRGLEKVAHEWRLLMMGHNMRKLARAIKGQFAWSASERLGVLSVMA